MDTTDCNIHTLRLLRTHMDKQVIETLNLHKSLINLTITIYKPANHGNWMRTIEKILLKQDYHYLKNVNILITRMQKNNVKQLFDMLKKNIGILKHQFNKLNFGFQISDQDEYFKHTFEWNSQIDGKFLDQKQQKLLDCQEDSESEKMVEHKNNFDKLLNEWL